MQGHEQPYLSIYQTGLGPRTCGFSELMEQFAYKVIEVGGGVSLTPAAPNSVALDCMELLTILAQVRPPAILTWVVGLSHTHMDSQER